ncbi:hypothetical protein LMH87_004700 [Akanthomyces muscarius]|uniref:Uncharacterized protein n=1 Tax=Akanthomyces muscarius TaxID=2231603 RepID=A0A9W8Q3S9_AKAMU|nr:hypothetical protein LMH87_004700 [Akanthomyces muscarius]KAJ4145868.1 hypothetical protein LMH87_004700 [Akanthomyces muscarius]
MKLGTKADANRDAEPPLITRSMPRDTSVFWLAWSWRFLVDPLCVSIIQGLRQRLRQRLRNSSELQACFVRLSHNALLGFSSNDYSCTTQCKEYDHLTA